MSTPDELLVQRQLRAAEIALETARRQRFETDETMRRLQAEADAAAQALAGVEAEREAERVAVAAQLEAAHAAVTLAEQAHQQERRRRVELEQHLTSMRRDVSRRDDLARQLAAERRIAQLEGELEVVLRRAAEFEHEMRVAALDAFRTVRNSVRQVNALLAAAGLGARPTPPGVSTRSRPEAPERPAEPQASAPAPVAAVTPIAPPATGFGSTAVPAPMPERRRAGEGPVSADRARIEAIAVEFSRVSPGGPAGPPGPGSRDPRAAPPKVAAVLGARRLDARRLDAALDRLRAHQPPPAEDD